MPTLAYPISTRTNRSYYLGLPDPFAVVTVDGDQTNTTTVMKKTLNPYWNESFEVYVAFAAGSIINHDLTQPGCCTYKKQNVLLTITPIQ